MWAKIISTILPTLGRTIDKAVLDKDEAMRLKSEMSMALLSLQGDELKHASNIIIAEAQGESPAQRNWRPHLMYLIMGLLVFNGVLVPLINMALTVGWPALELQLPILEAWTAIPDKMWSLLQIGLGGYIVGRSGEKMVKTWAKKGEQE